VPGRRQALAREGLRERRLAGSVATDQSDPIARGDPEARRLEQNACAEAQLDGLGCDH